MFTLNGTYLRTKIIIYFNILLYIAILYLPPIPVNLLKNAAINIAMLIFTNILEMHCLKVANMYEYKYQYRYLGYQSDALTVPCMLHVTSVLYQRDKCKTA